MNHFHVATFIIIFSLSACSEIKNTNVKSNNFFLTKYIVSKDLKFIEELLVKGLKKQLLKDGSEYIRTQTIFDRLCKANHFEVCPNVILLNSKKVTPPQSSRATIIITSSTVNRIKSNDQFAFILGHELSHIIHGDTNRMTNSQVSVNLKKILKSSEVTEFFDDPGFPGILSPYWFAMTLTTSLSRDAEKLLYKFDQDMEYQADILSIDLLIKAKYDPRASIYVLKSAELIFGKENIYNGFAHNMYGAEAVTVETTHPSYKNRLKRLGSYLTNKP